MTDWARAALEAVLHRVSSTYDAVGARFPLYADSTSGVWTTTSRGSWTGGFWAGLLWLRALSSGEPADRSVAAETTARLADWVTADTSTRGLILWYGTALATGPGGDPDALILREAAARHIRADFDHDLGMLPWGSAFGGPRLVARVDGVPGVVPLLATDPSPRSGDIARRHLRTHSSRWHAKPVATPAWTWSNGEWVPGAQPRPGWSRGRAWLLLALADACWHLSSEFIVDAKVLVDIDRPLVPAAEDHPDAPPDTSAAAIEAVALLKLAAAQPLAPHVPALRNRATEIIRRLATEHLSGPGAPGPLGRLCGGCYDFERGLATSHELIWGDFFFALALAIHTGSVGAFDI
ncbi:hypothetical protein [Nocardia arthritidis]|uniref:hypothetical protein n=1 Tax=Nocardia arthritidis TaxID=228602 RepID=UPI001C3F684E|nr:hypothetical protein [Nocardia arthritidis]